MKPRRIEALLDVTMAAFDDDADWDDHWTHVVWGGLIVAKRAAVAARYKDPEGSRFALDSLAKAYKNVPQKGKVDV